MYCYRIVMREFERIKYGDWIREYAVLDSAEVALLKKVLHTPNHICRSDFLKVIIDKYAHGELTENKCVKLCSAIIDKRFSTDEELEIPKYYVHVLPTEQGYLNIRLRDMLPLLGDTEEGWYKMKFTKTEIEELKQDPRFKGIDFDGCLEEVPK